MEEAGEIHRTIRMEAYDDKLLVLAEGSITVRIDDGLASPISPRVPRYWTALSIMVAIVVLSSALTLHAIGTFEDQMAKRIDRQAADFRTQLDQAVASVQTKTQDQTDTLMVKADDLGSKIDTMPERIDLATRSMTNAVSDFRQALNALAPPLHAAPILVIKRRKAALEGSGHER